MAIRERLRVRASEKRATEEDLRIAIKKYRAIEIELRAAEEDLRRLKEKRKESDHKVCPGRPEDYFHQTNNRETEELIFLYKFYFGVVLAVVGLIAVVVIARKAFY